jgi:hypothetical protein
MAALQREDSLDRTPPTPSRRRKEAVPCTRRLGQPCHHPFVEREIVVATYRPDSTEGGEASTYLVEVPSVGRGSVVPALPSGALDRDSATVAVQDLVVTWIGWERDSFDVELEPLFRATPQG